MSNKNTNKVVTLGLTFDDVLLIPQKSNVLPSEANLETKITKDFTLNVPLISSAMDTVTESDMAIALAKLGGLGIIHKNLDIKTQANEVKKVKDAKVKDSENPLLDKKGYLRVGAAVGVSPDSLERTKALVEAGVDLIVVDSAHGHSEGIINTIKSIRKAFPKLPLVGGNIVTSEACRDLYKAGVDAVKVGIGPGSICTTRVISGVGFPQLSAVMEVSKTAHELGIKIIADGGIKYSGDIAKAIGAGADLVMIGGLFAATKEAPGNVITLNGKQYKEYNGMGSLKCMEKRNGSKDRYFQGKVTDNKKLVPEGIESMVPYVGEVKDVCYQLLGGLRSGMGYVGAKNIKELQTKAKFVQITSAGLIESHPHDVIITRDEVNYKK